MSDDKPPIDCRMRPPEWTSNDEFTHLHKRIDSMLSTIANQDKKYNYLWDSYEKRLKKIYNLILIIGLLCLFKLIWSILVEFIK